MFLTLFLFGIMFYVPIVTIETDGKRTSQQPDQYGPVTDPIRAELWPISQGDHENILYVLVFISAVVFNADTGESC